MTVGELLSRISSQELAEWIAFYQVEPFGPYVDDLRFGISSTLFANANRDPKARRQPFTLADFMMSKGFKKTKPKTQNWEQQLAVVVAINKAAGGQDLREKS